VYESVKINLSPVTAYMMQYCTLFLQAYIYHLIIIYIYIYKNHIKRYGFACHKHLNFRNSTQLYLQNQIDYKMKNKRKERSCLFELVKKTGKQANN